MMTKIKMTVHDLLSSVIGKQINLTLLQGKTLFIHAFMSSLAELHKGRMNLRYIHREIDK